MSAVLTSLMRIWAVLSKEAIQMRRDRLTFAMLFGVPMVQLILFGFAINMNPKHLPTALLAEENTPFIRTLTTGLKNSEYFDFVKEIHDPEESQALFARGEVSFVVTIPAGFTRALVRGEHPQILVEADASDPAAASNAVGSLNAVLSQAMAHDLKGPLLTLNGKPSPFELVVHASYNPDAQTSLNIVPGLLGVILTMTLVMITSVAMTREVERGTLENLLAMPARPFEVMLGKILPYMLIGAGQTIVILTASRFLFHVPFVGPPWVLLLGVAIFVVANLALGFTFSTLAQSQLQAIQLTFFWFLPSMLLSGFMFPFRGMPDWAQRIGEILPLTHFLRIVRGVMLKGATFADVQSEMLALCAFTGVVMVLALLRYRRTLD